MRSSIRSLLASLTSLDQIKAEVINFFSEIRKQNSKIGYVSGVITSDGQDKIEFNRKKLIEYTNLLEDVNNFPLFSAVDVFSDKVYKNLQEMELEHEEREKKFMEFWGGGYELRSCHRYFYDSRMEKI